MIQNPINKIYSWSKKYFLNIFGVIGVLGTFYFSLFYVPDYVDYLLAERTSVIHESIVNDVQEFLFNNQELTVYDIQSLIKGKELSVGATYRYNVEELLVQVEDRFMSNKFIPLEKRKELVTTINNLRKNYKPPKQQKKTGTFWNNLGSWGLSGLGVLLSILGVISLSEKYKREQEIEADIEGELPIDENTEISETNVSSHEYEKMIKEICLEIGATIESEEPYHPGKPISRPDFEISINNHQFLIECKKYKKLVGLRTVNSFFHQAMEHGKPSILISSTNLTSRATEALKNFNEKFPDLHSFSIVGVQRETIKKQLEIAMR